MDQEMSWIYPLLHHDQKKKIRPAALSQSNIPSNYVVILLLQLLSHKKERGIKSINSLYDEKFVEKS